jgi:ABC-type nitrate/sulfonate/bicarbonate transport system substrate-binding protein
MIALPLTGNAARAEAPDANPVVIRYLSDHGFVPAYELADALGFLKGKGIRLENKGYATGAPQNLAALAAGSIDLASAATPAIINAIAGGAKILSIAPRAGINKDVNSKFFVLDSSLIKDAKDLKGKSIAINVLGAHLDYTIQEYLRMHGLNKDDVRLVKVDGPELDNALRNRQADVVAVGVWQGSFGGKIAAEGGVRVLFTDHDVLGDIVLGSNFMQKGFIEQHAQAVREFVTASAKAVDWSTEHPDEARKLIAEILKKRGEDPAAAVYWSGYGLRRHALYQDHDIKFWLDVLAREGKVKPGQFSPEDIATNKYNADAKLAQH